MKVRRFLPFFVLCAFFVLTLSSCLNFAGGTYIVFDSSSRSLEEEGWVPIEEEIGENSVPSISLIGVHAGVEYELGTWDGLEDFYGSKVQVDAGDWDLMLTLTFKDVGADVGGSQVWASCTFVSVEAGAENAVDFKFGYELSVMELERLDGKETLSYKSTPLQFNSSMGQNFPAIITSGTFISDRCEGLWYPTDTSNPCKWTFIHDRAYVEMPGGQAERVYIRTKPWGVHP